MDGKSKLEKMLNYTSKARSSEDGSQEPKSSILQHMFTQSIFQDLVYNRLYHLISFETFNPVSLIYKLETSNLVKYFFHLLLYKFILKFGFSLTFFI